MEKGEGESLRKPAKAVGGMEALPTSPSIEKNKKNETGEEASISISCLQTSRSLGRPSMALSLSPLPPFHPPQLSLFLPFILLPPPYWPSPALRHTQQPRQTSEGSLSPSLSPPSFLSFLFPPLLVNISFQMLELFQFAISMVRHTSNWAVRDNSTFLAPDGCSCNLYHNNFHLNLFWVK